MNTTVDDDILMAIAHYSPFVFPPIFVGDIVIYKQSVGHINYNTSAVTFNRTVDVSAADRNTTLTIEFHTDEFYNFIRNIMDIYTGDLFQLVIANVNTQTFKKIIFNGFHVKLIDPRSYVGDYYCLKYAYDVLSKRYLSSFVVNDVLYYKIAFLDRRVLTCYNLRNTIYQIFAVVGQMNKRETYQSFPILNQSSASCQNFNVSCEIKWDMGFEHILKVDGMTSIGKRIYQLLIPLNNISRHDFVYLIGHRGRSDSNYLQDIYDNNILDDSNYNFNYLPLLFGSPTGIDLNRYNSDTITAADNSYIKTTDTIGEATTTQIFVYLDTLSIVTPLSLHLGEILLIVAISILTCSLVILCMIRVCR